VKISQTEEPTLAPNTKFVRDGVHLEKKKGSLRANCPRGNGINRRALSNRGATKGGKKIMVEILLFRRETRKGKFFKKS